MSTFKMQWLAALALGAGVACGGSSSSGPSSDSLMATWIASPAHSSTSVEYVEKSNPSVKLDIVAVQSATVTLSLKQDKTFELTSPSVPSGHGTWSIEADGTLTLTYSPTNMMQFDAVLKGGTLTLSGADAPFDVDDDGTVEACKLNMKMVPQ